MNADKRHSVNQFARHTDEQLLDALRRWAADEREREGWRDEDKATYNYRAALLEEAVRRLEAPPQFRQAAAMGKLL